MLMPMLLLLLFLFVRSRLNLLVNVDWEHVYQKGSNRSFSHLISFSLSLCAMCLYAATANET